MGDLYKWLSYKGHLAHLFPQNKRNVTSLCGRAYLGDEAQRFPTNRQRCSYCEQIQSGLSFDR